MGTTGGDATGGGQEGLCGWEVVGCLCFLGRLSTLLESMFLCVFATVSALSGLTLTGWQTKKKYAGLQRRVCWVCVFRTDIDRANWSPNEGKSAFCSGLQRVLGPSLEEAFATI